MGSKRLKFSKNRMSYDTNHNEQWKQDLSHFTNSLEVAVTFLQHIFCQNNTTQNYYDTIKFKHGANNTY